MNLARTDCRPVVSKHKRRFLFFIWYIAISGQYRITEGRKTVSDRITYSDRQQLKNKNVSNVICLCPRVRTTNKITPLSFKSYVGNTVLDISLTQPRQLSIALQSVISQSTRSVRLKN